jgi:hypothetical protein
MDNPCGTEVISCDCALQLCAGFTACTSGPDAHEIICEFAEK